MPEYPGVYVVELDGAPKPIPGVSTRIADEDLRAMALVLRERLAPHDPPWTEGNDGDPGVMLLELFAWVCEALVYRNGMRAGGGTRHAARLAARSLALLARGEPPEGGAVRSARFLCGWRARLDRWIAR